MSEQLPQLSDRELEILRLLATGVTNQEIAQKLVISTNTVKVHLRNIFAKLQVTTRTEATMVAVHRGWVKVPLAGGLAAAEELTRQDTGTPRISPGPYSPASILPIVERWPRVHWTKRVTLIVGIAVAVTALLLPQIAASRSNGQAPSAISGLFPSPSPAAGSLGSRWQGRAQMPTPRNSLAVVADAGLIYAIGGIGQDGVTGKVEVYDPQADAWTARRSKPTPAAFVGAAVVGTKIYVPGGLGVDQQVLGTLEAYDPAQDTWIALAPLPQPLAAYGIASFGDAIYLFGGTGKTGYTPFVYRYDPATDTWEQRQPMAEARGLMAAATLEDRIYVVGGFSNEAELSRCDLYDPATDAWSTCPPMIERRGGLALVAVRSNLYAVGGGIGSYLAFNERYDARLQTWSRIETPVAEQWRGLGLAFIDPYVYAIGGWSGGNLSANEAYQALFSLIIVAP